MLVSTIHRIFLRCLLYNEAGCILEVSLCLQSSDSRKLIQAAMEIAALSEVNFTYCFLNSILKVESSCWIMLQNEYENTLRFLLLVLASPICLFLTQTQALLRHSQHPDTMMMSSVTVLLSCVRHGHTET